ncbi:MAG TPA: polysaccharide deacetylase family protein [Solirubrobacteraceae bacterium]|nr:polysaccharide deacetylase family protein [Solirubrobacteraceae bacterium]
MTRVGPIPLLLATALLAPVAAIGAPAGSPVGRSPRGRRSQAEAPAPPPSEKQPLYRISGCRSTGTVAYYHGPARREVAIGFDDGPAPDTAAFVKMLAANHTRATFFMIGRQISSAYRKVMLRELREGDVLGDHTFTHPDLEAVPDVREQLQRTLAVIRSLTGYTPCVFRPPYGDYDTSVLRTARSLGLATVLWNVDPSDWEVPPVATIVSRVLAEVQPGSIIISHDGGGPRANTLAAYPRIIAALRRRGLRIVTIPELLGFRPVYVHCVKLCDGLGLPRDELPRDAIVTPAP